MKVKTIEIRDKDVWITGSEDGWNARQVFCDIHEVSGVIVAINPFNQKPMFVVKDREQLEDMVRTMTRCQK